MHHKILTNEQNPEEIAKQKTVESSHFSQALASNKFVKFHRVGKNRKEQLERNEVQFLIFEKNEAQIKYNENEQPKLFIAQIIKIFF